ncbi:hypothetical protein [Thiolapillus sp.]|uniref:hypothetical protein n=1 Tax=Thiolapillus sp. TaxID=2017437 RepID=UPI003AF9C520
MNQFRSLNTWHQLLELKESGLPPGSGTVESAIHRVINLRTGAGFIAWGQAENILFLRSSVLTVQPNNACLGLLRTPA